MDAVTFQAEAMRCERLMYHVGYSILHNDQDCADAVQEALTRAWQKHNTLRNPSRFRPWLMKILVNTCRDMLRQRQKIRFVPLEEDILPTEPPAEPLPLKECIDLLRPEWRITVLLYYLEGFSVAEIADTLGVPQGWMTPCFIGVGYPKEDELVLEQYSSSPDGHIHMGGW